MMRAAAVVVLAALLACDSPKPEPQTKHVEIVKAGGGDVAPMVAREEAKAESEGRTLLVYVGATWCEPCQRFHQAASEGKLDQEFGKLRLLEFDLDADRERLAAAGYTSRLIPLLAVPRADGTASDLRMEGSIKGEGAVDEMTPRLEALLQRAPARR